MATTFTVRSPRVWRPAPARADIDTLLSGVLDSRVQPGKVFDREIGLDAVPDGYRAMDARESLVRP
jgi:threonine dehydrogenase-like Zn-dependent dehydrogenase